MFLNLLATGCQDVQLREMDCVTIQWPALRFCKSVTILYSMHFLHVLYSKRAFLVYFNPVSGSNTNTDL